MVSDLGKAMMILAALLWAGVAAAADLQPAELPPPDFPAQQYIDSKGCVFLRKDQGWVARVARDDTPLCGYPPTMSARRLSPDQVMTQAPAPAPQGTRAQQIEAALISTITTQLRPGELAGDPRPLEHLPDMGGEPADNTPTAELRAEIAAQPQIRQAMTRGLRPNHELCRLLGYDQKVPGKAQPEGLGQDPSQGFCDQLPRVDLARLAFSRPVPLLDKQPEDAQAAGQGAAPASAAIASTRPTSGQGTSRAASVKPEEVSGAKRASETAKADKAPPATGKTSATDKPPAKTISLSDYVPPGARYVQIGAFAQSANADRAVAKLQGQGLPVLRQVNQGKGERLQILVAGPFADRQAVVIALDKVRRAGFRDAYAR